MKRLSQCIPLFLVFIVFGQTQTAISQDMSPSEKAKQEYDKELSKYIFETTHWEPGYGVKLLNKKATKKLWEKYTSKESKCRPYSEDSVHHIFSTEHVHILVYAYPMHRAQA